MRCVASSPKVSWKESDARLPPRRENLSDRRRSRDARFLESNVAGPAVTGYLTIHEHPCCLIVERSAKSRLLSSFSPLHYEIYEDVGIERSKRYGRGSLCADSNVYSIIEMKTFSFCPFPRRIRSRIRCRMNHLLPLIRSIFT